MRRRGRAGGATEPIIASSGGHRDPVKLNAPQRVRRFPLCLQSSSERGFQAVFLLRRHFRAGRGSPQAQQTSPTGQSKTKSSGGLGPVRAGSEDVIATWSKVEMHPASWPAMAGLCARKILCPERRPAMGDSSPETWFRILRAAEDVALMTKKTSEPRRFKIVSANVSSWRPEHRQWLVDTNPDVALVQETRWHEEALAKETIAMAKLGYEMYSQPSPST